LKRVREREKGEGKQGICFFKSERVGEREGGQSEF
jgi:hypothetical protein